MSTYLNWLLVHTKYNIIATKGIVLDQIQAKKNVTELPKMLGRVAIVTGGARGIGLEIVKMLLQCDMDVIIACRNLSAGHKAIETIKNSGINYSGKPKVMVLDNSKFKSVQKFVQDFKKDYTKLDILINNAGIMFTPYEETEDGFEQQYQVNYLSHFYLTLALIPLLNNAGTPELNSRIINVSSCAHLLGKINFDDFNYKQDFNTGEAYAQSKLAQLMFTKKLARLFESKNLPIKTHAVHPGVVNTDLFEHSFVKHLKVVTNLIFKTPKQGATSIVYAAVSPDLEKKNGLYLSNCLEYSYNPLANDCDKQDKLFDISLKQAHMQSFNL